MLEKQDVKSFGIEEKYQIIEAYMQGGGAKGLQIEMQSDEGYEEEMDEQQIEQLSKGDQQALEMQFMNLYKQDSYLR